MGVKVEVGVRVALAHFAEVAHRQQGVEHAEGVGQHDAAHVHGEYFIDHFIDVFLAGAHAVRPVFQIDVDADAEALRVFHLAAYVGQVFVGCFAQLQRAVALGAFAKQVDDAAAATVYPVD